VGNTCKKLIAETHPMLGFTMTFYLYRNSCIYSYTKSQQDALFLKFILIKNSMCFGTDLLSIIRSLKTIYTAIGICHANYVDCLLVRSG